MQNNLLIHSDNLAGINYLLNNGLKGNQTSFLPNFPNKTTSVAREYHITTTSLPH
ncbi:MAG: hypothetical protein LBN27_00675 [Prevotellaceae bacterium]|jgi:hypothetical protein|nr:hypothetical protein [Prevotellaceae bacterium]